MIQLNRLQSHKLRSSKMGDKLIGFYESIWQEDLTTIANDTIRNIKYSITNPYLLFPSAEYEYAAIRVMIFGQETFTWGGEFQQYGITPSVTGLLSLFDLFVNEDWGSNTPFWRFVSWIREYLRDERCNNIALIPNNLVKVGRNGQTGFDRDVFVASQRLNLINREIDILHPDIIISLSGPSYDNVIKDIFGDYREEIIDLDIRLSSLHIDNLSIPFYRLYHPKYLNISGNTERAKREVLNIINKITS